MANNIAKLESISHFFSQGASSIGAATAYGFRTVTPIITGVYAKGALYQYGPLALKKVCEAAGRKLFGDYCGGFIGRAFAIGITPQFVNSYTAGVVALGGAYVGKVAVDKSFQLFSNVFKAKESKPEAVSLPQGNNNEVTADKLADDFTYLPVAS
ncbi:MAG: hypothetical protein BGO10_08925 [Chlamydia sp. 32-24]|nr:MAG: hypothetical protein BGO10_08925 [Chlamydia sp. 32-24]